MCITMRENTPYEQGGEAQAVILSVCVIVSFCF